MAHQFCRCTLYPVTAVHVGDAYGIQMTDSGLLIFCCSGDTAEHPGLLQYACRLSTNIRPTAAARVHVSSSEEDSNMEVMAGVLGGRPVLALCFEDMEVSMLWLQDVMRAPCVVFCDSNGHEVCQYCKAWQT